MNPQEIARVILRNIGDTYSAIEDGPTGYVFQFDGHMHLLCMDKRRVVRKDHPLNDDVVVLKTEGQAVTMQRYWNHEHPDDKVFIRLRGEALLDYINAQQQSIDMLAAFVAIAEQEEQPK